MENDNPIINAILQRTSIRTYTDRPVEREHITTMLRAAMAAPSGKNIQPWVFLVVTDHDVLDDLADVLPNGLLLKNAPACIMVGADMFVAEAGTPGLDYWKLDCAAAAENLLLAAGALGLGAVWLGVTPVQGRVRDVKEILRLPAHITPMCLVAVGYPEAPETEAKDKFDTSKIHWERW